MATEDLRLLNYLFLAAESHRRKQIPGRDRFLLLTLISACEAGMPELADQCRQIILHNSPHHLLSRYSCAIDAMRSEEFQVFTRQIRRFCTSERAEQLAQGLGYHPEQKLEKGRENVAQLADELINLMKR